MTTSLSRCLACILFLSSFIFAQSAFTFEQTTLLETVQRSGNARVIIIFNHDQTIEALRNSSSAFKPEDGTTGPASSLSSPDAQLAAHIAAKAETINKRISARTSGLTSTRPFKVINGMAATVTLEALEQLQNDPDVSSIILDRPEQLPEPKLDIPDKPSLNDSTDIIGADDAWSRGYTGSGWSVAVLDTGVRTSHEMFADKDIVEACFSTTTTGTYTSESNCPNGEETQLGTGAASPNTNDHGTHCAGIALGNNQSWTSGEPHYGVARDAGLIAIQVFSYFPDYNAEYSWSSDQLEALEYVYTLRNTMNIAAVSMSLGGSYHTDFCSDDPRSTIINQLKAADIATVIATGNDYYCDGIGAPACIDSSIAVGATTKDDARAAYSNFNDMLQDVYAPGSLIQSAVISDDSSYGYKSGTSMATPHVAGALAILKSKKPGATVDEMETALKNTGVAIPGTTYYCTNDAAKPRINVADALEQFSENLTALPAILHLLLND